MTGQCQTTGMSHVAGRSVAGQSQTTGMSLVDGQRVNEAPSTSPAISAPGVTKPERGGR